MTIASSPNRIRQLAPTAARSVGAIGRRLAAQLKTQGGQAILASYGGGDHRVAEDLAPGFEPAV